MYRRNHSRFLDIRMRHRDVLQRDRTDPFASGLDDVLRPVGDFHEAVWIDRGDVASGEPAVRVQGAAWLVTEIRTRDPGPAHQEVPECGAIPRQLVTVAVNNLHI